MADAGLQKGTDMRRKTILHALSTPTVHPLMSPTRKRAGIFYREGDRLSLTAIAPYRSAKVWWNGGCATGKRIWRQQKYTHSHTHSLTRPPTHQKLSNVIPAGSLTDQILALRLFPNYHSLTSNSKSPASPLERSRTGDAHGASRRRSEHGVMM